MRRIAAVALTLVMLLTVFTVSAGATPPTKVEGTLSYMARFKVVDDSGECVAPDGPLDDRDPCMTTADGNLFAETVEDAAWSGDLVGDASDDCIVMIHSSGAWFYKAIVSFDEATVGGPTGSLEIQMLGRRPDGTSEWQGTWVILRGDGDLKTLRGQGTWSGPGAPDVWVWGNDSIRYEGQVHFKPK